MRFITPRVLPLRLCPVRVAARAKGKGAQGEYSDRKSYLLRPKTRMQAQQALLRPIPGGLNVPQPPTTEVVQQYLEDNEVLITTILECINTGRVEDAVQYQQRLQQNLMWLAGIADTQPQPGAPPAVIPGPTVPPPPGQMQFYATGGQVVMAAQAVAAAAVQAQSTAQQPGAAPAVTQPPS